MSGESSLPPDTQEPTLPPYVNPHARRVDRDRLGRKQPARLDTAMLLNGATRLLGHRFVAERLRAVPQRAIVESGYDEDGVYGCVECPCGAKPIARPELVKCSGCERFYVASGANPNVYVVYGDMAPPPSPPPN